MSFHAGQTFTFGEQPSASKWQYIWDNDYALADGTGISDNAIITRHVLDANITPAKLSSAARWWEELGRTTLSGAGDTISVTSLAAKKYLKIIVFTNGTGGTTDAILRLNNDSSTSYKQTAIYDNAGTLAIDNASSSTSFTLDAFTTSSGNSIFAELDVLNVSGLAKLMTGQINSYRGTGNDVTFYDTHARYTGTSVISRVDVLNNGTGDFAIGSEVIVLGHD